MQGPEKPALASEMLIPTAAAIASEMLNITKTRSSSPLQQIASEMLNSTAAAITPVMLNPTAAATSTQNAQHHCRSTRITTWQQQQPHDHTRLCDQHTDAQSRPPASKMLATTTTQLRATERHIRTAPTASTRDAQRCQTCAVRGRRPPPGGK
jgi:hypothetical protein